MMFLFLLLNALLPIVATAYDKINGHNCIRSMEGMLESMNDLANTSNLLTIKKIGDSYLKKNPGRISNQFDIPSDGHDIYAYVITDPSVSSSKKGKALYTSGMHAREYAPSELAGRFIEKLVNGFGSDAEVTTLLQRTEIHVVLYVNPDGRWVAERYKDLYWRKNLNPNGGCSSDESYGVDLNRNFDFVWGDKSGASDDPCDSDYFGSKEKSDPEQQMNQPFGEEISGLYADIHASGGYVYYPWGHQDNQSPDDEALQALGRKVNSFNDYLLWAGGQPDYLYAASGDASDYMYGALGVASLGFEIGDDFYQECSRFDKIVEINMPALMYTASIAKAPFKTVKGPDIMNLDVSTSNNGEVQLTGKASDSEMVNSIVGKDFSEFKTGDQDISEVRVYLDVHPEDYTSSDTSWLMEPSRRRLVDANEEEGYTPKRSRTAAAVDCSSYTEKKKCKRHGAVLQADGTWLGVSQICEWYTTGDICGISSFTETGATTTSLTDGSINIGEGQSTSSSATTTVLVTTSETTTTTSATTEASTTATTTEATTASR